MGGQLLGAERKMAAKLGDEFRKVGHEELARLVAPPQGQSLLVVMVRYFLRRQVEEDPQLFQGLAFAQLEQLQQRTVEILDDQPAG